MKLRRLNIIPLALLVLWLPLSRYYPWLQWWGYGFILLFQLAILVYGCINIQSGYFMPVLCNAKSNESVIALSFDDGPHPVYSTQILDTLKKYNVPAAFFCIGKNINGSEAISQRMHKEGHVIGNHSYTHDFWFDMHGHKKMLMDMQQMDSKTEQVIGVKPLLFRPPYGVMNPNLRRAILKGKYIPVGWSVRSLDTAIKDKQKLLLRVTGKIKAGDIILLHDSMELTANILPELIEAIQNKGYKIIRLDELLHIKAYA